MAITINGVVLQELVDQYTEAYSFQGGPSCRKGFLCAWSQRFNAIRGILGINTASGIGGVITLNSPVSFPDISQLSSNIFASDYALGVEVVPVGNPTQGTNQIQWPYCKLYVTYGTVPWSWGGVDPMQIDPINPYIWAEQHINYTSEYLTFAKSKAYWGSSGGTIETDADLSVPSPLAELTITLKNVPYLPAQAVILTLQKPINSATFLGVAPGYLMFMGASDGSAHYSDGTPSRDVTLSYLYRSIAQWDYSYNDQLPGWDQVVDKTNTPIIQRSDISQLIPAAYNG